MTKLKDITVLREIYDPHLDGYLVAGKLKFRASETKNPYIVAWRSRLEQRLVYKTFLPTKGALSKYFSHIDMNDDYPDMGLFKMARLQERVYKWEAAHVLPYTEKITHRQAHDIVRQVATNYGIEKPTLKWLPEGTISSYAEGFNRIKFSHRDKIRLLHEMAHAIHCNDPEHEKGALHSPAFTRIAIELYHRYAGIDLPHLLVTANQYGILGDMQAPQNLHLEPKRTMD